MKKAILLTIVIMMSLVGIVQAQDIHGAIGIEYSTKYVWRGFTVYGQKSAIHPFIDLDLGNGFGINTTAHRANASGYENGERWDYTLYYKGLADAADDAFDTQYMIGYRYYNYPDSSSHESSSADLQELHALLSWPNLLGVDGLVPRYCLVKLWGSNNDSPVSSASGAGTASGFAHIFMLDYAMVCPGLTSDTPEQVLNFHTELVFNDGVDPRPGGNYASSDWTNAVIGVSTDFDCGGMTLTPGLFYQLTMEDDPTTGVSPDHDILWGSVTITHKF